MNEYYSQDITFCSNRKCNKRGCERHQCHVRWDLKPYHSFADLEGTEYCTKKKPTADVVAVVRCKDCEHNIFEQANSIIHCNRTGKTGFRERDDFCKYGKRKEGTNNG